MPLVASLVSLVAAVRARVLERGACGPLADRHAAAAARRELAGHLLEAPANFQRPTLTGSRAASPSAPTGSPLTDRPTCSLPWWRDCEPPRFYSSRACIFYFFTGRREPHFRMATPELIFRPSCEREAPRVKGHVAKEARVNLANSESSAKSLSASSRLSIYLSIYLSIVSLLARLALSAFLPLRRVASQFWSAGSAAPRAPTTPANAHSSGACRRAIGAARRSHALARSAALQPHGAPLQPLAKVRWE
jgi:hypothetical protein